jgi:transcription elongation factor GreB
MNKAFTKESDDEEEEGSAAPALPAGSKNYMTPKGYQTLKAELKQLLETERPSVVQVVSWAAGNGDRSENGDYIYGKKRLREIDRRIRFLIKRLENSTVVLPSEQQNPDQVFFGAIVEICDVTGGVMGAEECYQIVGVDEANASDGRISWISPLARALFKAREGDTVRFQSPAGVREIEVQSIRYED